MGGHAAVRGVGWGIVMLLAALALASSGTLAAASCKKINGKLTVETFAGPDCASAVNLCATVTFKGDVAGTGSFIGTSIVPTADTPTTGVVLLTGDTQIETGAGTLLTKDAVVFQTVGAGNFAEVDTITGGTGAWAGYTGVLRAQGAFEGAIGTGEYSGEVCAP